MFVGSEISFISEMQINALVGRVVERARLIRLQEAISPNTLVIEAYSDHSASALSKSRMRSAFVPGECLEGLRIEAWKYAGGYTAPALAPNSLCIHVISAGTNTHTKSHEDCFAWNTLDETQSRLFWYFNLI